MSEFVRGLANARTIVLRRAGRWSWRQGRKMLPHTGRCLCRQFRLQAGPSALVRLALNRYVSSGATTTGPLEAYEDMVKQGAVMQDSHQVATLVLLQQLSDRLATYKPAGKQERSEGGGGRFFKSLFGICESDRGTEAAGAHESEDMPKGMYMYGGVGTGKTFMMDLFFRHSSVPGDQRQRLHFLDFMMMVHQRMHRFRKDGLAGEELMERVVDEMMAGGWLLCFDEFQVTDIADAMIIRQLFERMWARGLVMVATSNRPPQHLYHNGLQRALFLPFIASLQQRCQVHSLEASSVDYRLIKGADSARTVYVYPDDLAGERAYEQLWVELCRGSRVSPVHLHVQGHDVAVPCAVIAARMARFTFAELCGLPLGAADYGAVAAAFHTVFITRVPRMTLDDINRARRFITLVDTLYERNVKLVCLAECPPTQLFAPPPGAKGRSAMPDEVFAFDRTASRLAEMQGREYLKRCWRPSGPEFLVNFEGQTITEDLLLDVWRRYDLDGDDKLDINELFAIMQDVSELKSGHRNVPEEAVQWTFRAMDPKNQGYINRDMFVRQGLKYGINVWWGGQHNATHGAAAARSDDGEEQPMQRAQSA
ncbi:AFG1-like ATPase-domain-containing protein [Tribonema minus]|uniref:AFG1-like ATPase-domain-containing protein n=1 Tax=Tribonema minus TaxID=303371 RepID=A0A836C7Q8_9STRA|nr:AFG1-like ATPase-domain-containing protein [Tribonema minus]